MQKSNTAIKDYKTSQVQICLFSVTRTLTLWANLNLVSLTPSNLPMKRWFRILFLQFGTLSWNLSWDFHICHFRFGRLSGCLIGMVMAWWQRQNSGVYLFFITFRCLFSPPKYYHINFICVSFFSHHILLPIIITYWFHMISGAQPLTWPSNKLTSSSVAVTLTRMENLVSMSLKGEVHKTP